MSPAEADESPRFALMVAVEELVTTTVEIVNVVEDIPAGIVTVLGTVATGLVDASVTWAPPVGATPLMVNVPLALEPPPTVLG